MQGVKKNKKNKRIETPKRAQEKGVRDSRWKGLLLLKCHELSEGLSRTLFPLKQGILIGVTEPSG